MNSTKRRPRTDGRPDRMFYTDRSSITRSEGDAMTAHGRGAADAWWAVALAGFTIFAAVISFALSAAVTAAAGYPYLGPWLAALVTVGVAWEFVDRAVPPGVGWADKARRTGRAMLRVVDDGLAILMTF